MPKKWKARMGLDVIFYKNIDSCQYNLKKYYSYKIQVKIKIKSWHILAEIDLPKPSYPAVSTGP